jgi:hypothetical protein
MLDLGHHFIHLFIAALQIHHRNLEFLYLLFEPFGFMLLVQFSEPCSASMCKLFEVEHAEAHKRA